MASDRLELQAELEERLAKLGYDVVQVEWAGSSMRPVVRLRIERSSLDRPVSVADCAEASRSLESWLDAEPRMPDGYVLEVSSPGVERPLTRARDFLRFRGRRVAVKGRGVLCGRDARLEGELLGTGPADRDDPRFIRLRLQDGAEVDVPRSEVKDARLVCDWGAR